MRARTSLVLAVLGAGCIEVPSSLPAQAPASAFAAPVKSNEVVLPNGERFAGCPEQTVLRGHPLVPNAGATYCVTEVEPARRHGPFASFYPSGKLLAKGWYHEGNPDGQWTTFHENGKVLSDGNYVRGTRTGLWKFARSDGAPLLEETLDLGKRTAWVEYDFRDGKPTGFESFVAGAGNRPVSQGPAGHTMESGNLLTGQFEGDKGEGIWEEKTPKGSLVARFGLEAGFAEKKVQTLWPETGKLAADGELLRTLPQGHWTLYHPGGEKHAELLYEKGLLRSIKVFYSSGKTELAGELLDGAPHATWTTYHPDGTTKTTGAYAHGIRQGMWRTADATGKPLAEGLYEDGVLADGQRVDPIQWAALGLGASLQGLFADLEIITAGRGRVQAEQRSLSECMLFGDPAEKCLSLDWENFPSFHKDDGAAEVERRNKQQDLACAMNNPAACARVGKRLSEMPAAAKDKKKMVAGHYQKACDLSPLETAWKAREKSANVVYKDFHSAMACVWLGRMLEKGEVKSKAQAPADLYQRACDAGVEAGCTAAAPKKPAKPAK